MSEEEWRIIHEKLKKDKISFSSFALSSMLSRHIKSPLSRELLYELTKIGANINQIAKKLNSDKSLDDIALVMISNTNELLEQIYTELGKKRVSQTNDKNKHIDDSMPTILNDTINIDPLAINFKDTTIPKHLVSESTPKNALNHTQGQSHVG
nr:plasmid mobilization relaxosome protein MobC [Campylobacter suis]